MNSSEYLRKAADDPLAPLRENPTVPVPQAANWLGISPGTVYRLIREGEFPAIRIGGKTVRVRSSDLLAMLEGER